MCADYHPPQGTRDRPRSPTAHIGEHLQQAPNHQKFSRYRAVRNAAAAAAKEGPLPAPPQEPAAVKRSMTRYKTKRPTDPPGHTPAVPKMHSAAHPDQASSSAEIANAAQQEAYIKLTGGEVVPPALQKETSADRTGLTSTGRRRTEGQTQAAALPRQRDPPGARRAATDPVRPAGNAAQEQPAAALRPLQTAAPRSPPQAGHAPGELVGSPEQLHSATKPQPKFSSPPPYRHARLASGDSPQRPAGFDAPISAVNAGTRTVAVECGEMRLKLDVEPSTTVLDLLEMAASQAPLDPRSSVLSESFSHLGLERPLRHYERVRDVLNSWDRDTQHSLQVQTVGDGLVDGAALRAGDAPPERPGDTSVHVHYSHKPGSWDKRWVTLRSNGQVCVAKTANAKPGESRNICHMCDFDVYVPTARRLKKLRAPRRYAVAIKSQQKSAMFESTANFVHFFCANDKDLALQWFEAAQRWRSWYLISRVGLGDAGTGHAAPEAARPPARSATEPPARRPSAAPQQRKLTKDAGAGKRLSIIQKPAPKPEPDPFASGGLLGRTYEQRQKATQESQLRAGDAFAWPGPMPVAPPPGAPVGGGLSRSRSARTARGPALQMPLMAPEPPPLPPPQVAGAGLIEAARNTDPHINTPLHGAAAAADQAIAAHGGMVGRSTTLRRSGSTRAAGKMVDLSEPSAFLPGSLLAGVERYQAEHEPAPDAGTVRLRNGRVLDTKVLREADMKVGEGM